MKRFLRIPMKICCWLRKVLNWMGSVQVVREWEYELRMQETYSEWLNTFDTIAHGNTVKQHLNVCVCVRICIGWRNAMVERNSFPLGRTMQCSGEYHWNTSINGIGKIFRMAPGICWERMRHYSHSWHFSFSSSISLCSPPLSLYRFLFLSLFFHLSQLLFSSLIFRTHSFSVLSSHWLNYTLNGENTEIHWFSAVIQRKKLFSTSTLCKQKKV